MTAALLAAAAALLAAAAGCAYRQPVPSPIDLRPLEARHAALLEARRARIGGTLADVSLWLETATTRYPGTRGTYGLGGRDTLRLRVASSFGTALDLAGAGDSLWLWLPSQRALVRLDPGAPPLALPDAAAFGVRVVTATWGAPAGAWREARAVDSVTVVHWLESGDTLEVAVGTSGLPRRVRIARPGMRDVRVAYLAYGWHEGTPWPERFDVEVGGGALRLSVRVRRLTRTETPDPARWRPDVPAGAEALAPEDLWRWIEEEWTP